MFCPECGKGIEAGSAFCPECGAKISSTQTIASISQAVKKPVKPMGIIVIMLYTTLWAIMATLLGGVGIAGVRIGLGAFGEGVGVGLPFGMAEVAESASLYAGFAALLFYLVLFYGIFGMAASYGLWFFSEWGRNLAVILYILSIPLTLLSLIGQHVTVGLIIFILVGIAVSVAIILYLSSPPVKKLFQ